MPDVPKQYVLKADPVTIHISPYGFYYYASRFLAATPAVDPAHYSPVPYYCVCRALELALKAFLLAERVPVSELKKKKLGHNLDALLELAMSHDLTRFWTPSVGDRKEIAKANVYYAEKGFEYFQVGFTMRGYPELPLLPELHPRTGDLLAAIRDLALAAA